MGLSYTTLSKDILQSIANDCVAGLATLNLTGWKLPPGSDIREVEEAMRLLIIRTPLLKRLDLTADDTLFRPAFLVELVELIPLRKVTQ